MKRSFFSMLAISAIAVAALAGCRGAACGNCGACGGSGYGYGAQPQQQPVYGPGGYAQPGVYQQPPAQYGQQQGGFVQPTYPGVLQPQTYPGQLAPVQGQPGTVYGGGVQ